jgi:hypothetical protein
MSDTIKIIISLLQEFDSWNLSKDERRRLNDYLLQIKNTLKCVKDGK